MDVRKVIMMTEEYRFLRGIVYIGIICLVNFGILDKHQAETVTDIITMIVVSAIVLIYAVHEFRVKVLHSNAAVEEEKTTFMQFIKTTFGKLFKEKEEIVTAPTDPQQ